MEGGTEDSSKLSSRENSSRGSIKSTKSLEKNTSTPHSNTGSLKSDKDVHFAKSSVKIKDCDNQKHLDASLKVPHKFITNWRQACDRTRDRTRDLLKRWRTLPEFEGSENDKKVLEKKDSQTEKCGWSVHVWSKSALALFLFFLESYIKVPQAILVSSQCILPNYYDFIQNIS